MSDLDVGGFSEADFARRDPVVVDTRDPWLERRTLAWGASEMPMVLAITGRRAVEALPDYLAKRCRPTNQTRGRPRLYAEKAGLVQPLKAGSAAKRGQEREQELLDKWAYAISTGEFALPEEQTVNAFSICHASEAPREWMPLRARRSNYIAVSPDAWCRDVEERLYDVECKCPTTDVYECHWYWQAQVQAQGMATGSCGGFVVAGCRWGRDKNRRDDGPIVRCFVEPDEHMRRELAEAAEEAWAEVEKLKTEMEDAQAT